MEWMKSGKMYSWAHRWADKVTLMEGKKYREFECWRREGYIQEYRRCRLPFFSIVSTSVSLSLSLSFFFFFFPGSFFPRGLGSILSRNVCRLYTEKLLQPSATSS